MNRAAAPPSALPAPPIRRRLACFVYEGVLLFGVVMLAGYVFAGLAQQRHALQHRELGMAFLFIVLGAYFVWFWLHGGQTLPMKTWRIRVVANDGSALPAWRALARYVAAWLWFLPPLAMLAAVGVNRLGGGGAAAVVTGYVAVYAALAQLLPQRQFLHDVLCGTQLVDVRDARAE